MQIDSGNQTEGSGPKLWVIAVVVAAASLTYVVFSFFRSEEVDEPGAKPAVVVTQDVSPVETTASAGPQPSSPPTVVQQGNSALATTAPKKTVPVDPDGPPPPPPPPPIPQNIEQTRDAIDQVQFVLRDYRLRMGGNPVGDNAEITRALLGDNVKQVKFSVPETSQVNGQGELCDAWGTPYFFHAVSKDRMEVRSAGPDRKMWTPDDVQM